MSWAARLAALSEVNLPDAVSADSVDSPQNRPNGSKDTNGKGDFNDNHPQAMPVQARANGTIGTIDKGEIGDNRPFADDPEERAAIEAEALPVRRLRPRAAGPGQPQPGDYCGCCKGSLWWTETEAETPKGWRCCCCHPPAHLAPGQFRAVAT
jgi:hypothetical protein